MANRQLQAAYKLMEQGQKKEAAKMVREVLAQDKNNANAWWLMSMLLEDEEKRIRAIERVLSINPDHKAAKAKLLQLRPGESTGQNVMATQEMMNLDWSKLKDDPHPDKQKVKNDTDDHKVATYGMMALGGFVLLVVVVIGVMFVVNTLQNSRTPPDEITLDYLNAIGSFDWDTVASLTCTQYRGEVDAAREEFTASAGTVNLDELNFDFSGMTATTTSSTDTTATVELGGTFTMSIPGLTMDMDMDDLSEMLNDDTNVSLVLEDNEWRVCEPRA